MKKKYKTWNEIKIKRGMKEELLKISEEVKAEYLEEMKKKKLAGFPRKREEILTARLKGVYTIPPTSRFIYAFHIYPQFAIYMFCSDSPGSAPSGR
jgi:hypothetical protein